jgi:hypothetical protein
MPDSYDRTEPVLSGRELLRARRETNSRSERPARSERAAYQSSRTAQGRGDENRPTALSLLDKYTQTQDKLQSFIIKGETHYPYPSFSISANGQKTVYTPQTPYEAGSDGKRRDQWELTIDPEAAHIVRHARCNWDPDTNEVEYQAKNSGLVWNGPLAMPQRIIWQRRGWRGPYIQQVICEALEPNVNQSLLSKARAVILAPYPADTEVSKYTRDDVDDDYNAEELLKLLGLPLPPFECIGIGFGIAEAKGTSILICFFDMNQRPSRYMVTELAKRNPRLKEEGIVVICVQASKIDKEILDLWAKDSNIPFMVGVAEDDESKI